MGVDAAAAAAPAAPRDGRGPPPRWGALLLLFALGVSLVANASAAAAASAVEPPTAGAAAPAAAATAPLPFRRPPPEQRAFRSPAVDSYLDAVYPRFKDRDVATLFVNSLPNTLDTTVRAVNDTDAFVITGDIEAMWLRDSAFQVLPYLNFTKDDPALAALICNLARRQAYSIVHVTPYANAFNYNASGAGHQQDKTTPPMGPGVWEMKYELDSLAAFLRLSRSYYQATGDAACFHYVPSFEQATTQPQREQQGQEKGVAPLWLRAVEAVLDVVQTQQAGTLEELGAEGNGGPAYMFQRETPVATDTLMMAGIGPMAQRCGLSKGYFRPSDDAVTFSYHIPSQAMTVVELRHAAAMLPQVFPPPSSTTTPTNTNASKQVSTTHPWLAQRAGAAAARAAAMADEIDAGIRVEALVPVLRMRAGGAGNETGEAEGRAGGGPMMLAYEIDGFGSFLRMDDANVPSLLALPYIGYMARDDPLYQATRRFVLSPQNPFYFEGTAASGVGGPHIGPPYVWPMALIVQALTSDDDQEIEGLLKTLVASSAGTGFIHESFHASNASDWTRDWFAWGNGMFGELVMTLLEERPHLLLHDVVRD